MTTDHRPADDDARQTALDVSRSFIVQAPAGSGKTELLTQRFLALLALVDHPEEVWAITFTRKAAAEMRRRIQIAMDDAVGEKPAEEHRIRTWELARAVVKRDQEKGWELGISANRIQVFTIDSLCAKLVRQMPVLSGFGTVPVVANFPQRLYIQAARRTLESLHEPGEASLQVSTLLSHLDNNAELVESLLSNMLASRDRWLPHVAGDGRDDLSRPVLEEALNFAVESELAKLDNTLPDNLADEIIDICAFAASNITDPGSPVIACRDMDAIPHADAERLAPWLGIRHVFLKSDRGLRKAFRATEGFPAIANVKGPEAKARVKEFKARAGACAEALADYPEFVGTLKYLNELPAVRYSHEQWQVFLALRQLLTLAVAHLKLLFQEVGEVDYTEISHRALTALGGADNPTDLALHLDYRLKHLLVDEFQDTARSQFELVQGLVNGWQQGDGRSLFLVGDPMQSIYRFREANVGLFLHTRDFGIADVKPEFLQLNTNFRSNENLVNWCNSAFADAFPANDNMDLGAVRFSSALAAQNSASPEDRAVQLHGVPDTTDSPDICKHIEAELVARIIRERLAADPDGSIAVLVRARTHLTEVLPALRSAGIRYRAVDLEDLKDQPVVRDLYALTRALLHVGDRGAWLTVLRAPWCGLTLKDLHALAGINTEPTIWELMINASRREELSDDGQMRLSRVKMVLAKSLAERGRRSLSRWIEGAWVALGGPACIFSQAETGNTEAYFRLLDQVEADGFHDDIDYLADIIQQLRAADDTQSDSNVQIMTIHRAKGLEFDTVIVPGMHKASGRSDAPLLRWLETTQAGGERRLMLAPISATGDQDSIHRYLGRIDSSMSRYEDLRLLYVAATRARHQLHLVGAVSRADDDNLRAPRSGSFFSFLHPGVADELEASISNQETAASVTLARPTIDPNSRPLVRVPSAWMLPGAPHPKPWRSRLIVPDDPDAVEFSWASETARHIGTVVHRVLQQVATDGPHKWMLQWNDTLDEYLNQMLMVLGVPNNELADAQRRCETAIRNTIVDDRGQWILSDHEDAHNELELTSWLDGHAQSVVLDRTFLEDGVRWIVDYKTGSHEGGTVDAFLDTELERYQPQLERYARVMWRMDSRPMKLALYFPMLQGWREWNYVAD